MNFWCTQGDEEVRDTKVRSAEGQYGPARGQSMNSHRCNLRTISGKTPSTPEGLTVAVSGPSRAERVSRRRLHLRLPTVSRFAGPLLSPDLAYQLRQDARRKSSETPNPNLYAVPQPI